MNDSEFDVLIIGGGPGGYVAAIRASQLGLKTALVEEKLLGGICLNWGCIPTKALLQGAEVAHTLSHMQVFGFTADTVSFDLQALVGHSRAVADRLSGGIDFLMRKNGITVIEGRGRVSAKGQVSVTTGSGDERALKATHIILATGARPRNLPGIEADGENIWTYFEAMVPQALPASLLVIGSGAIGVEFASLYNDLGVEVTVVELLERVMPTEDREVSEFAAKSFAKRGIAVHTATGVASVEAGATGLICQLEPRGGERQPITVEKVILAAGIRGNIENLGLEELGVETARGFIVADQWCRTTVAGLYAIGDVSGPPCLAHKASHEGVICVEHLAGVAGVHPLDKSRVPGCTYCRPQVASVGLSEAAAIAAGHDIKVGRFNLKGNGKALAIGDSEGFVKTVFDRNTGELLGAHMIGPEVTEQIQGFGIAQGLEATEAELLHTVFAHPTLSEAMHEAVLDAEGRALHA